MPCTGHILLSSSGRAAYHALHAKTRLPRWTLWPRDSQRFASGTHSPERLYDAPIGKASAGGPTRERRGAIVTEPSTVPAATRTPLYPTIETPAFNGPLPDISQQSGDPAGGMRRSPFKVFHTMLDVSLQLQVLLWVWSLGVITPNVVVPCPHTPRRVLHIALLSLAQLLGWAFPLLLGLTAVAFFVPDKPLSALLESRERPSTEAPAPSGPGAVDTGGSRR